VRAKYVWVSGMCITTGRREAYAGTYVGITGDFMGKGKSLLKEKRRLFFCCSFALAAGCHRFLEYKPFYQLYPVHMTCTVSYRTYVHLFNVRLMTDACIQSNSYARRLLYTMACHSYLHCRFARSIKKLAWHKHAFKCDRILRT
jgi:hypothetical protein